MNTKNKTIAARIVAIVLCVFLLVAAFASVIPAFVQAADAGDYLSYPITSVNGDYDGYTPIPILVVQVSFDADGDGKDANPDGSGESAVKDENSPSYGEQWCHTTDEQWQNSLFATEGRTLRTYYEYMSNGNFYFTPAEEIYGTENDGIIHVVLSGLKHPAVATSSSNWMYCFKQIIEAADEYVDFSKYDTNGNGKIDTYELGLCFLLGGYENSSSAATPSEVFGFHAYYKSYDSYNSFVADGVEVAQSGFFAAGSMTNGTPLVFATIAHELGHYLGAPDLYDTDSSNKFKMAINTVSLMGSGSFTDSPAHIDPWNLLRYGFYDATIASDGEYTLYSKASDKGTYNIIKICTPNPDEYYLVENRYASSTDESNFDTYAAFHSGIMVYHIDESVYRAHGNKCNTYYASGTTDPAIVAYPAVMKNVADSSIPSALASGKTWTASKYVFPISKKWYTAMTAEQAAVVADLKFEVTSANGTEMTIKISGAYSPDAEITSSVANKTATSFTVNGEIAELNSKTINNITITLSEKLTGKEVKSEQVKVKANGKFSVDFADIATNTKYTYTITADTSTGNVTNSKDVDIGKTNYTVTMYKRMSDNETPYTMNVEFGEKISYNFLMRKSGYAFCGWYMDEALTQKYDMDFTQSEAKDITLYAKWAPENEVATLNIKGASVNNKIFSVNVGERFITPDLAITERYEFAGYYLDEAYTIPFDITAPVTQTGTITVYAKIVEKGSQTTEQPTQTTLAPEQTTAPADQTTDACTEPTENNGGSMTVVIIAVVAVVIVAGVAVAFVIIKKKK